VKQVVGRVVTSKAHVMFSQDLHKYMDKERLIFYLTLRKQLNDNIASLEKGMATRRSNKLDVRRGNVQQL